MTSTETGISIVIAALAMNSMIMFISMALGPIILCILVISAAWIDCRSFRIPNRLIVSGAGIAMALNVALPAVDSLFGMAPGAIGIWQTLGGAGIGFGVLFPLYLTRTLGAGDVKLMAMIGAFLGPSATLAIILLSLILGGVLSLVIAINNKNLRLFCTNIYDILIGMILHMPINGIGKVSPPRQSAGRMPYALAITGGVFLYFLLDNKSRIASYYF